MQGIAQKLTDLPKILRAAELFGPGWRINPPQRDNFEITCLLDDAGSASSRRAVKPLAQLDRIDRLHEVERAHFVCLGT